MVVLQLLQIMNECYSSFRSGAKPKKCIAIGLAGGNPFEPVLKVWEENGKFFPKPLSKDHFKHLGKDLLEDLSEDRAKPKVLGLLNEYVARVDGTLLRLISCGSGARMWFRNLVGSFSFTISLPHLSKRSSSSLRDGP